MHDETQESYEWFMSSFLRCHGSIPSIIYIDQDSAIINACEFRLDRYHLRMNAKKNMKDSAQREAFYSLFFATCESSAERALEEFESKWILSKSTEDDSAEIEEFEFKKYPRWWKGTCHSLSAMKSAWIMGFMNMKLFSGFMTGTNRSEAFHSVVQSEVTSKRRLSLDELTRISS